MERSRLHHHHDVYLRLRSAVAPIKLGEKTSHIFTNREIMGYSPSRHLIPVWNATDIRAAHSTHVTLGEPTRLPLCPGNRVLTDSVPGFVSAGVEAAKPCRRGPRNLEPSPQCLAWRGLKNDPQVTHHHHL